MSKVVSTILLPWLILFSYLTVYTLLVAAGMLAAAFCVFYYVFGSIRSARIVHQRLVTSVLGTTLRFVFSTSL